MPRLRRPQDAPTSGKVVYTVQPTTGNVTPATVTVNGGPIDPGGALVYDPVDYPADPDKPVSLIGKTGAIGTKGAYFIVNNRQPDRMSATLAGGLSYGAPPFSDSDW